MANENYAIYYFLGVIACSILSVVSTLRWPQKTLMLLRSSILAFSTLLPLLYFKEPDTSTRPTFYYKYFFLCTFSLIMMIITSINDLVTISIGSCFGIVCSLITVLLLWHKEKKLENIFGKMDFFRRVKRAIINSMLCFTHTYTEEADVEEQLMLQDYL